jgi:hypothetical protein
MVGRAVIFLLGCALAWLVLLLLMAAGIALFIYAACAEVIEWLAGAKPLKPDAAAARKAADRVCGLS